MSMNTSGLLIFIGEILNMHEIGRLQYRCVGFTRICFQQGNLYFLLCMEMICRLIKVTLTLLPQIYVCVEEANDVPVSMVTSSFALSFKFKENKSFNTG